MGKATRYLSSGIPSGSCVGLETRSCCRAITRVVSKDRAPPRWNWGSDCRFRRAVGLHLAVFQSIRASISAPSQQARSSRPLVPAFTLFLSAKFESVGHRVCGVAHVQHAARDHQYCTFLEHNSRCSL